MGVSLSVAVMAHPSRRRFVKELQRDGLAGVPVVWDKHNDRWDTGRRSMLRYDAGCEWHLVVQDDAVLAPDFIPGIEAALAAVPSGHPVAFYTGRVRPSAQFVERLVVTATHLGRSWLEFNGPWWGVAVAVPTAAIPDMIDWGDQNTQIANYDKRMARYFALQGVSCWYSLPSLVDHRVEGNPSLVPGRGNTPSRTAFRFIGDQSPLDVDWNTPACSAVDRAPGVRGKSFRRNWRNVLDGRTRQTVVGSHADQRYAQFPDQWIEVGL